MTKKEQKVILDKIREFYAEACSGLLADTTEKKEQIMNSISNRFEELSLLVFNTK